MQLGARFDEVFQLSYITRDIEAAVSHAQAQLNISNFDVFEATVEVLSYGVRQDLTVKVAVANIGSHQFEIIQPVAGPIHIYTDEVDLSSHILNWHHIAIAVKGSRENWDRLLAEVRASGDEFALLHPAEPDPEAQMGFCYVDTRARLGHYTEYLWGGDGLRGASIAPWLND